MARVRLDVERPTSEGVQLSLAAANADGYWFGNDGAVILLVENVGASVAGLSIQAALEQAGLELPDQAVNVPAGEQVLVGPFDRTAFNRRDDPHRGSVYVDFTGAVADLRIQAFQLS